MRDEIETHLQTVQQNYEKLSQGGSPMRYMETFCHETAFKDGELDVLSICVPFLELQKHNHQSEGKLALPRFLDRWSGNIASPDDHTAFSTTSHSPRTLFQLLNPRNNTRRDLKQVICQMLAPTDRRFLNVSQTWMVIVNNGTRHVTGERMTANAS